jgi:hypothetical protein
MGANFYFVLMGLFRADSRDSRATELFRGKALQVAP